MVHNRQTMGIFEVQVRVSRPAGGDYHKATLVVDTGAAHSALPASFLEKLDIHPDGRPARPYELANKEIREYETGEARFGLVDEDGAVLERTSTVIFADEGCFLLGATTLQEMGLTVDLEHHRLSEGTLPLGGFRGQPTYLQGVLQNE